MEPCLFGFLLVFLRLGGLAGSRPGGRGTFFCFAKRKYPKKRRAEVRAAARFLALLASWGKFANLSAARPSDMRISDPHAAALLSPATRQSRDRERTPPLGACAFSPSTIWREGGGKGPHQSSCRRRCPRSRLRRHALASSAGPGGSGLRMSEGRAADKFAQTPPGPSNAVCPKQSVGTAHPARLSLGYLSLAKQRKVTRPPGRDPAKPTSRRSTR